MFDLLSCEYGWSTNHILKTTIHEINWRMREISKRKYSDYRMSCAIHGITIEDETEERQHNNELSESQENDIMAAFKKAKARRKGKYGE